MLRPSPQINARRLLVASATVVAALCATTLDASGQEDGALLGSVERTAWLMGTRVVLTVDAADRETALAASEAALTAMERTEDLLTTWRDDSELSRLNRTAPGTLVHPTPALAGLLAEVARWSDATSQAFHPAVGALIDAWQLRGDGRVPDVAELRHALDAAGERGVAIDATNGSVVRRSAAAWLDAGAWGKGAALREARLALRESGATAARIDLGGQVLLIGSDPSTLAVADPVERGRPFADLRLADVSVATSGQTERGIEVDGERYGHLLDPRTGRPVPAWGSVTVVHTDPLAADVLATALFVLGPEDGLRRAAELDVAALFVVSGAGGTTSRTTPALHSHSITLSTPSPRSPS